ncbi:TRAP transporter substrate-binding protein [Thermus scotoductus]|uniref:TRAP transporter substrate-binding protein n=1 Tax=Thermus scotoductus TaxID=37636 RepID=A0A430S7M0_THESC|nr:TAXI family TRAP transporter solute-binding subunit [Thermus scotoductus]RTG94720.1 TRAP transporter substrate-binding protein [Thermus scotoductus]RTH08829.1 TRAP transporter substrate-binding protein [Thermus scotoductus]RTH10065.1 TRAP transporter substrate-binding protein [Thermus scotoductus]RTH12563.1 TRAP transporter substrate-binding protein [Thermus scotoductus]RTH25812.1 TRAP transporter substrate-binding protein [Thermus scotoductus]
MRWSLLAYLVLGVLSPVLAQKSQVLIGTGGVGGVYFYYGTAVAEILNKAGVVQAQAMQSGGSIENLMLLRDRTDASRGVYYCGTVLPDAALMAHQGEERFQGKPAPVRILFTMYPNYFHVVTTEGSGIRVLQDLKGKRVSTEVPGGIIEYEARILMSAAIPGFDPRVHFAKWERTRVAESAQMLSEGNLDAFFWSGGLPTGSIVELAGSLSRKGKRLYLVPLPKESTSVQVLMRRFPGVVDTGVIPKSVYNTRYDTPTLTFWNVFVCPASLLEDVAYGMVKAVFENLSVLHAAVAPARDTTLENAVRSRGGRIPYHEGAIRFFREKGVWR